VWFFNRRQKNVEKIPEKGILQHKKYYLCSVFTTTHRKRFNKITEPNFKQK